MGAAHAEVGHDDENELLQLVNSDRAANGLLPVQMDGRLQADSRAWSAHLAHVAFEHDPNSPWYDCPLRSENVAFGQRTIAESAFPYEWNEKFIRRGRVVGAADPRERRPAG